MKTVTSQREPNQPQNMVHALHALFLNELADLQNAEKQLIKALPNLVQAAQADELKAAIESHWEETKAHAQRLNQVAKSLGTALPEKTCAAMKGLLEEGSQLVEEQRGKTSLDAAIIAAAQKVEHYEIASYGTVRAWAQEMGHDDAADLLSQTLDEESAADEKLTEIAESLSNGPGESQS